LVTGPMLGGLSLYFHLDLLQSHPGLARWGINPFSVPALIALALCILNWFWVRARFKETLPPEARREPREARTRNPVRAILLLDNPLVRRANIVAFVYSVAFVAMESSLTFLAFRRFGYSAVQNTQLLVFLGVCSIVTQGYIIRKLLKKVPETRILVGGLALSAVGLAIIAFAGRPWLLYVGLAFLATGSGLVNPSTSGLISLYSSPAEQGRVLGVFRSLGSLSRAITPLLAGVVFWAAGATVVFAGAAAIAVVAGMLSLRLPQPEK
jgi:predicted MFS family arabinose efflux permease